MGNKVNTEICQIHGDRHHRSISASPQYCNNLGCCAGSGATIPSEMYPRRSIALNVPLLIPLGGISAGSRRSFLILYKILMGYLYKCGKV